MILGSGLIQAGTPSFGTLAADSSDSALFSGYTPNVAVVGPVSRRLYFGKSGGTWRTLWTDTSGALLRGDEAGTYAVTRASDGPEPFDSDTGLATDVHAGSVSSGTTFSHEADCLIEFTVNTLPSTSTNLSVRFRCSDVNAFFGHQIAITQSGDFLLQVRVSGTTTIATAAGVLTGGERIVVVAENNIISGYINNAVAWTYASADTYKNDTDGAVFLGGGSVISDLIAWPRTLSGTAASILDKASA